MADLYTEIDALQKEINSFKPFSPHLLKELKEYYKIGLTYTSNALEGNSITETETKVILEDGLTIGGKPLREHFEVIGHAAAYNYVFTLIHQQQIQETNIKRLHKLFYQQINAEKAGKYRTQKIFISGSDYIPPAPDRVPTLMKEFVKNINQLRKIHPVELAALAHKEFVFIHPYIDGNGRVARLLMNLILLQEGYEIAIIPPILRVEYLTLLEKAHKDDRDFIRFIAERVKETQKDYLRLLKG